MQQRALTIMGRAEWEHGGDLTEDEALSLARSNPAAAELIVRAATITARELEFRGMVEAILDLTVAQLGADVAHLTSVVNDEELRVEGHRNLPPDVVAELTGGCTVHHGLIAGRAAETGEIQVVADLDELDPSMDVACRLLSRTSCRGMVAIPLSESGRLIGVLTYATRAAQRPSADDRAVLRIAGKIFSTGLAKARTFESERRLRTQLEGIHSATLAISKRFQLRDVLQCIVDQARSVAGARYAALGMGGDSSNTPFNPWVFSGVSEEQARAIGRLPRAIGLLGAVPRERHSICTADVHNDPRFVGLPPHHPDIHSFVGVVVDSGEGGSMGNLFAAEKLGAQEFAEEDVRALELLAQHAAIAIEHARVHDRLATELAERTRVEQQLRASEERYRTIVEVARDGIWTCDGETITTFANPAMAAMLGYSVEEMIGRPVADFIAEDARADIAARFERRRVGESETHDSRLLRKDGGVISVLISATSSFDAAGRWAGALAIVTDVTERNRARDALQKVGESLAFAQRVAQLGSWDWDVGSGELFWSDETYRIVGRPRESFKPTFENFISTIHMDDRARVRHAIERAIAGAEHYSLDHRIVRPDGTERVVHEEGDVVFDADGRALRMVGTVQDVTTQRRFEAAMGRLAAIVSSSGDAVVGVSPEGMIDEWNPGAERLFGWRAEDILGRPLRVIAPEGRDDTARLLERVRRGETITDYETTRLRRDGSQVDVELTISPIRDASGAFVGMATIARDITGRKRAEAALRRSEEQIRELLAHAADGIFHTDPNGRYVDVNDAGARMLGCAREDIVGKTIEDFVAPDELPRLRRAFEDMMAGRPSREEWTMLRRDGTPILVEVSAKLLPDGRFQGLTRDVTDRRRAQDALRAAEERLRLTIDEAPIGMAIVALDGRFVRVNKALCEMVRYSPEELQRLRFQDITHPEDLASDLELAKKLLDGEIPRYHFPKRYVRKDRSIVEIVLHGSVVRDARGNPLHFIAQIVDVTEQHRAQRERERLVAALEQERAWLRAVIDRSPVGIVLFEGQDRPVVRANRRAEELFGRQPTSAATPFASPTGRPLSLVETPAARALRGELVAREELAIVDGHTTPVIVSATPIQDPARHVLGAVMVVEDITAQKELERLRKEWVSLIAHDLRQPVAAISAHAQILARRAGEGPMRAGAEHVLASARRLNRMIGDLLDLSRLEAHRLELDLRPVTIERLVNEIVDRVAVQLHERRVHVRATGPLPPVLTDALRLEQILGNLISNAVKYGTPATDIDIELTTVDNSVRLSVINRGPGISSAELPTLFERFRRTEGARVSGVSGVGLGLYITRGLVEANGGRIWAESEPGGLTAFRFTLPIAKGVTRQSRPFDRDSRESIH